MNRSYLDIKKKDTLEADDDSDSTPIELVDTFEDEGDQNDMALGIIQELKAGNVGGID